MEENKNIRENRNYNLFERTVEKLTDFEKTMITVTGSLMLLAGVIKGYDYLKGNKVPRDIQSQPSEQVIYAQEDDEFALGDKEALRGLNYYNGSWNSPTNNLEGMLKKIEIQQKKQTPNYSPNNLNSTSPVTPEFIEKITNQESTYDSRAVSKKGARGLMQIMKPTWYEMTEKMYGKRLSYEEAFNPEKNRAVGEFYLKEIDQILTNTIPRYENLPIHEQQKYIAAAYNGGITRLIRNKGKIKNMPDETREYVAKL